MTVKKYAMQDMAGGDLEATQALDTTHQQFAIVEKPGDENVIIDHNGKLDYNGHNTNGYSNEHNKDEEELDDPHGHSGKLKITNLATMMHILKGNIGTGILAMPEAFLNAGITVGSIGLVLIALMCVHCMHLLLKSATVLCERTGQKSLDYAAIVEMAFQTGPKSTRKLSRFMRHLTNAFIIITQIGFCTVYLVFTAQNYQQVVEYYASDIDWGYQVYMAMLLVPLLPINLFIRNLKYLSPFSTTANLLQVVALIIIFYYLFLDVNPMSSVKQFGNWDTLPLFFGTAVFAFEGIALVMPIENSMKTPKDFRGLTGVLNTCMVWIVCLYIAMGFYGYLEYNQDAASSITLNLPDETLAMIVRIFYGTAIFLSYSIQFYVPIHIMWPGVQQMLKFKNPFIAECIFRLFFLLLTFALGSAIPNFGIFISLVGSFGGAYLSIMLPSTLECVTFWESGIHPVVIVKNIIIFIIGIIGLVTGLYSTIIAIIDNHDE